VGNHIHNKNKTSIQNKPKITRFVYYNQFEDLENWLQQQLLLCGPFIGIEESQKSNKNTWKEAYDEQIEKFYIQTTSFKNCGDEWINLQEYASNFASSKDFSI
jgi:hypothetical protein